MSCEDIQIFPEKSDEREFLFVIELCAETKLLVDVNEVHRNFLVCGLLLVIRGMIRGGLF
jgi:hypothetical protein